MVLQRLWPLASRGPADSGDVDGSDGSGCHGSAENLQVLTSGSAERAGNVYLQNDVACAAAFMQTELKFLKLGTQHNSNLTGLCEQMPTSDARSSHVHCELTAMAHTLRVVLYLALGVLLH